MTLTIFSTCRPFVGDIGVIQTNAITSWTKLKPAVEVLLIGDEEGTETLAKKLGVKWLRNVQRNRWGIPYLADVFWGGITGATNDVVCYANADVILLDDFMAAAGAVMRAYSGAYLMTGPRWDVRLDALNFGAQDWRGDLLRHLKIKGKRHKPTGLDYFLFTRQTFIPTSFPALAIGQTSWDAWLVWKALSKKIPVIDASAVVTAIHQHHDKAGSNDEMRKMNHAIAEMDRIGRGYIWETDKRIIRGPNGRLVVKTAAGPVDHWSKDAGWEGWG